MKLRDNYKEAHKTAIKYISDYILYGLSDEACTASQHAANKKIAYTVCEDVIGCNRNSFKQATGMNIDYHNNAITKDYSNFIINEYKKKALILLKERGLWIQLERKQ